MALAMAGLAGEGPAFAQSAASPAPVGSAGADAAPDATTGAAAADARTATTAQPSGQGYTVNTVVVTAQKRSQNLQDVPIVVTVVNKQLLQDSGVKDIRTLAS